MSNRPDSWHRFFSRAQFSLTFLDRDCSSLHVYPSRTSDSQPYGLIPGGFARFRFIAEDQADYTKGYKIACGDLYLAGIVTYRGPVIETCMGFTSDINAASVWIPEFSGKFTFVIKSLDSGAVLSRPWDNFGNGFVPRMAIIPVLPNATPSPDLALQQTFNMPFWSFRMLNMAYISVDENFVINAQEKNLYLENNQLAWGVNADSAALVKFVTPDPSLVHQGYLITVGGRYVQMVQADQAVALTGDVAQATMICIIANKDGTFSFWHCESDHILALKNGLPVFTLCNDPIVVPPSWNIKNYSPAVVASTVRDTEETKNLASALYIRKIVERLNGAAPSKRGSTWNYSFNNVLGPGWLISTPESAFEPYSDFEMPVLQSGANDFNLAPCSGISPDARHPCVPLASSVKAPGLAPLILHAGHSRSIYEEMYKVMISGNTVVDIMSLLRKDETPSGEFLAAIRNAISYLSMKPQATGITIRLLFGEPLGWLGNTGWLPGTGPYRSAPDLLRDLVRDIPTVTNSRMKVFVVYTSSVPSITWNHAKMIAVDGNAALVGGHNMWSGAYLRDDPVLDLSIRLSGLAAADAQYFADNLWFSQKTSFSNDNWIDDAACFTAPTGFVAGVAALPQARIFKQNFQALQNDPARSSGSGIPVLAVGREEGVIAGAAASDKAFIGLIDSATQNIYISAQAMSHAPISARNWWSDFLTALTNALKRGVQVTLFMSDPSGGSYAGDPPTDVLNRVQSRLSDLAPIEVARIMHRLAVRSFPSATALWGLSGKPGISNHAKVIMVDKKVFSVGSQNFYPSDPATMAEFSYIVEDDVSSQYLYDSYFWKLEYWALASPPIPGSVGDLSIYSIHAKSLTCLRPQGSSDINNFDQTYVTLNGNRVWPSDRYRNMYIFTSVDLDISLAPLNLFDNEIVLGVWESDWFGDDHLVNFKFHPNTPISCKRPGQEWRTLKLADLSPNTIYVTQGTDYDDAQYQLSFSFTKNSPS